MKIWLYSCTVGWTQVEYSILEVAYWNLEQTTKNYGKSWEVGHGQGLDEVKLQLR